MKPQTILSDPTFKNATGAVLWADGWLNEPPFGFSEEELRDLLDATENPAFARALVEEIRLRCIEVLGELK